LTFASFSEEILHFFILLIFMALLAPFCPHPQNEEILHFFARKFANMKNFS